MLGGRLVNRLLALLATVRSNLIWTSVRLSFHMHSASKPRRCIVDTSPVHDHKKGNSLTSVLGQYENPYIEIPIASPQDTVVVGPHFLFQF